MKITTTVRVITMTPKKKEIKMKTLSWHFWKLVHNLIIHPLLAFPYEPKWVQKVHDWTAEKCWGGG